MSIEELINRTIGYSLLYVQSGDPRHYAKANEAKASILLLLNNPPSEIFVLKERKGIPTVIEWNGDRYTFDAGTTFRGRCKAWETT